MGGAVERRGWRGWREAVGIGYKDMLSILVFILLWNYDLFYFSIKGWKFVKEKILYEYLNGVS